MMGCFSVERVVLVIDNELCEIQVSPYGFQTARRDLYFGFGLAGKSISRPVLCK